MRSAGAVGVLFFSFGDALQERVVARWEELFAAEEVDFVVLEGLEAEADAVRKIVCGFRRSLLRKAFDDLYSFEVQSFPAFEEGQV